MARGLMTHTLRGVPELAQFDNDEQAQHALREIEREAGNPASWHFWLAIAGLVVAAFSTHRAVQWMLRPLGWPDILDDLLAFAAAALVFWFVLRWLHRAGGPEALRRKLLERGIPVCLACGYSLRGQPSDSTRCPECGTLIDERARAALQATSTGDAG